MAFLQEYTMLEELGKGGFATVYKVRHNELGYIRAVRVLNETIVDSSSKTYQNFLRECKLLLRLGNGNHPNIVHIYQPRLLDNKALVEMDYVDGQDIMHYLAHNQNFIPADEVIRMAMQISSALAYCHEDIYRFCMDRDLDSLRDDPDDGSKVLIDDKTRKRLIKKYKVIHNDLHSGNIMRREDGNFILLDFGLAINGDEVVRSSRHENGAPEFKSPEKWNDESILTEQSDIYSFGVVMYQYLAGQVPFPYDVKLSKHIAEYRLGEAHQKAPVPPIENQRKDFYEKKYEGERYKRDYPQWLEDVIMRCLRKEPDERFKNGMELYNFILTQIQNSNSVHDDLEFNQLTAEKKSLLVQAESLRDVNNDLNKKLNDANIQIVQCQQDLRNAQDQISTLEYEASNQKNVIEKLKFENKKLAESKSTNKTPIPIAILLVLLIFYSLGISSFLYVNNPNTLEAQIHQLEDTIKSNEKTIQTLNSQVKDLSSSNKNTVIANKNKEIDALNARIKDLEQSAGNKTDNAEVERLNSVIAQKDATIKDLQSKVDKLSKSKNQVSQTNSDSLRILRRQVEQKQREINNLNKEIKILKDEL